MQSFLSWASTADTNSWTALAIDAAIKNANQAVYQRTLQEPALKGMGATVAVVLIWDGNVLVGHVGDCRVYVLVKMEPDHLTHG